MSLAAATAEVLAIFAATGMRATDDARDINPPCVYVMPPAGAFQFGKATADVTWTAYLIVGNAGARPATRALSDLIDKVAGKLPVTTFTMQPLLQTGGGDPLPAYELTWKSRVPIGGTTP